MKKIFASLITVSALTLGSFASVHAAVLSVGDPGKSWSVPDDGALGLHIQEFLDSFPGEKSSWLTDSSKVQDIYVDPTCKSTTDSTCNLSNISYQAVLQHCTSDSDIDCVSDFGIVDSTGNKTSATFSRYFPNKAENQYIGDSSKNVPTGGAPSLYTLPSAAHDGGNTYFTEVTLNGSGNVLSGQVQLHDFGVRIYPVKIEPVTYKCSGSCPDAGYAKFTLNNGDGKERWGHQGAGFSGTQYCVGSSMKEGLCAQRYAFPAGFTYFVQMRLKQLPTGWMHGRLSDPSIKISSGNGFSNLEIQGNPIAIPFVYKMYKYVDMPDAIKSQYDVKKGGYINSPACIYNTGYCAGGRSGPSENPLNRNVIMVPDPWTKDGMEQLKLWLPYVGDKATALLSSWSARTLSGSEMEGSSSCFNDTSRVTGIVTTNSTQYSAGPPAFNKATGTLDYQVASPHFGTTGDVFKGSYDLVMRSDVARCVYGFSKAPINATLSVTSADGTPQIATTVVGEKDGWLYLQAKNFEFSAPTVTAKLTQDAPVPAPVVKPAQKKITCVKGKVLKVVTTATCPKGYLKK